MFEDLRELLKEFIEKIAYSRLFALSVLFLCMFGVLISHLFRLQIIEGEDMLNNYIQNTERTVYTPGTRGNIYDVNGKILAYNQLTYSVTVQDVGTYRTTDEMNAMLYRLVTILEKHELKVEGKLEIGMDEYGEMIYTSYSETGRKGFLRDIYGLKSMDELDDEKGRYPSGITARELFEKKKKDYGVDKLKDEKGNPVVLSDRTALWL